MEKQLYWIWFSCLPKMDRHTKTRLISEYGSAENIYNSIEYSRIPDLSIKDKTILRNKNLETAQQIVEDAKRLGQTIITYDSELYPLSLKEIYNPPYVLYARGKIPNWDEHLSIGIVGTRNCTKYGFGAVDKFSEVFAKRNVVVVSGMARGIDSAAAQCALKYGGKTIAVLGSGVDVAYPAENAQLMEDIAENGLLLSEFPPGTAPLSHHFPMRNRIISGLSHGILVVESAKRGGSLITADLALEQGKDVFAIPGSIFHKESEGTNLLISKGHAKAVMAAEDILCEYLHMFELVPMEENKKEMVHQVTKLPDEFVSQLTEDERKIVELLISGGRYTDEIGRFCGMDMAELGSTLSMLEFGGYIKKESGNYYKLNI